MDGVSIGCPFIRSQFPLLSVLSEFRSDLVCVRLVRGWMDTVPPTANVCRIACFPVDWVADHHSHLLVGLMIINRRMRGSRPALLLVLSCVLSAVYFYGWLDYTWPTPYQPVQTLSIVLFTFIAYKNWSSMRQKTR